MRLAKRRGDDRLGQVPAEDLVARPAERRFGLRVPRGDAARRIDADEGIVRRVDDQPRASVAFRETGERAPPFLLRDGDDDEIGDRDREVLLIDGPGSRTCRRVRRRARRPCVVVPQRHVQHGANVIRDEVGVEEVAGARIGAGVVGGNDAIALERGEIVQGASCRCRTDPDSYRPPRGDTGPRSG